MTSSDTRRRHVQRVLQVVHYLWQHPQQDTPLALLAEMAHFSPYHFHRTYVAVMGESVNDTRQRLRLQLAALALRRQPWCLCSRWRSGPVTAAQPPLCAPSG